MAEVGVAFTNDEPSAHVIASRLHAAGIAARVDRGLAASYQVAPIGHVTVFVDEKDAKRAAKVVGSEAARPVTSLLALRGVLALVVLALVLGLAALLQLLAR
jgi:hypothetical protein